MSCYDITWVKESRRSMTYGSARNLLGTAIKEPYEQVLNYSQGCYTLCVCFEDAVTALGGSILRFSAQVGIKRSQLSHLC